MSRRPSLHLVPSGESVRWLQAESRARFQPRNVFLKPGWTAHARDQGESLFLELVHESRRLGLLTVQDWRLPGAFRQWTLLAEPDLLDPDVTQAETLDALLSLARRNSVDLVQSFSNMARWTDPAIPGRLADGELTPFGTYVVDLSGGLDAVIAGMHGQHRRLMRKGHKAAVEVRDSVDARAFVALMNETYERGGRKQPFPERYLERLIDDPQVPLIAVSAHAEGTLQAAVLVPHDGRRGYYLHGGSRARATPGASVLAHLRVMERLLEQGTPQYDLGGARRETDDQRLAGIFRFKRHFGGYFEDCVRWRLALTMVGRAVRAGARRLGG